MIPDLIKLFNCVAVKPGEHLFNPEMVNMIAARCGYLVHPEACTKDALKFVESRAGNFNSTFYKGWKDVDSLQEAEMAVLQMLHYLTTYGTDYRGKTFTMNDFPEEMRYTEFKVLLPCTERDLYDRIMAMLQSGIALNTDTLSLIFEQAFEFSKEYGWEIEPDQIKNREGRALYYIKKKCLPYEPFELMRIIMFSARGNTMIINDKRTFESIGSNIIELASLFELLDDRHIESLATIFYRYKLIFLTIRSFAKSYWRTNNIDCVKKINRMRRLARTRHKPLKQGVLQTILSGKHSDEDIKNSLDAETSGFIMVRLLNYLNSTLRQADMRTFTIRNGSVWIEKRDGNKAIFPGRIEKVKDLVTARLSELLKAKAVKEDGSPVVVRFPEALELAAPVSEKLFVGPMPYGSKVPLSQSSYIGIYWRNEWGTRDFDLWIVGSNGERMGWDGYHKTLNMLFSGDMTNADPEATEIMYCRGNWPDCTVRVNRFNGVDGSKFRLFFGTDKIKNLPKNYMVNPDTIRFVEDFVSDKKEMTVAVVSDNTAYFTSMNLSENLLPSDKDRDITVEKALIDHMQSFTPLREVLLNAGFAEYKEGDSMPDIDLSKDLSKDTLIALFS